MPITAVSKIASAMYAAVPAVAIVLSPSTSISESTVTGPTEVCLPLPVIAYMIIGRIDAYSPITGGKPASNAYAMPCGTNNAATVTPAVTSLRRSTFPYVRCPAQDREQALQLCAPAARYIDMLCSCSLSSRPFYRCRRDAGIDMTAHIVVRGCEQRSFARRVGRRRMHGLQRQLVGTDFDPVAGMQHVALNTRGGRRRCRWNCQGLR